jgi:hypothetical protein
MYNLSRPRGGESMPTKPGLLSRGKIATNRHTTFSDEAEWVIERARAITEVRKMASGPRCKVGSRTPRLKFCRIPAGLRVSVLGASARQDIYLYTDAPLTVERIISEAWEKR